MPWYHQCENPQAVESIYSSAPALERWMLREVTLHEDGPRISLRADLPDFPDRPPQRWHPEFTVAQVTVNLVGVRDLSFVGWSANNEGVFALSREAPGTLRFAFDGGSTHLRGSCIMAQVSKISGYATEAS